MNMETAMEFDDLKNTWKTLDERLTRIESLQSEAITIERARDAEVRATAGQLASRRALRPLAIGLGVQAVTGLLLLLLAVGFWSARLGEGAHFAVYGVLVQAYAIWLMASAGHELALLRRIRFGTAVLTMQAQLAHLRAWRSRNGLVFAYAGCFVWIPAMLMLFAWLGADVWTQKPQVVRWFVASGVVCAIAVFLGLRWAAKRPALAQAMARQAAGQSVLRAELALADVKAFDAEGR